MATDHISLCRLVSMHHDSCYLYMLHKAAELPVTSNTLMTIRDSDAQSYVIAAYSAYGLLISIDMNRFCTCKAHQLGNLYCTECIQVC